jgi:hypothetical protein
LPFAFNAAICFVVAGWDHMRVLDHRCADEDLLADVREPP